MNWNKHSNLEGQHAFLSASKSSWLKKNEDELIEAYDSSFAQAIGTHIHAYAADCIKYREDLKKRDMRAVRFDLMRKGIPERAIDIERIFPTLMKYVNDAVGYAMDPEVLLYYSDLCFGTADAIQFREKNLRIHDLKTGVTPAKIEQLLVYAGLFFLEYGYKPEHVSTELRIYQSDEIIVCEPEAADIREVMDEIVGKNEVLQKLKEG